MMREAFLYSGCIGTFGTMVAHLAPIVPSVLNDQLALEASFEGQRPLFSREARVEMWIMDLVKLGTVALLAYQALYSQSGQINLCNIECITGVYLVMSAIQYTINYLGASRSVSS